MIELQSEQKPYFYIGAAMLSVEVVYFLNLASEAVSGWAVNGALFAMSVSVPMLVGASLALMAGHMAPAKNLLSGGLAFGILWFMLALTALSAIAGCIAVVVSLVSFKMLQYHHRDLKLQAQQCAHAGDTADR